MNNQQVKAYLMQRTTYHTYKNPTTHLKTQLNLTEVQTRTLTAEFTSSTCKLSTTGIC